MIALSREAEGHVDRLIAHYEAKGRIEAAINLLSALDRAKLRIVVRIGEYVNSWESEIPVGASIVQIDPCICQQCVHLLADHGQI